MRSFSSWSVSWLLAVLCAVVWAQDGKERSDGYKGVPLRTHSLTAPYLDSDMQSRWFDFGGDTVIRADQYIRLTGDTPSRAGWLFSRVPLTATNWEIEIEFKIGGIHHLFGDGMAIWVTKQRAAPGPVFGSTDKFEGLGVFVDTYKNNRPGTQFPYIMAMLGDGNTAYDNQNDGKANELAGCSARGIRDQDVATKIRLTYFQDQQLTVDLMYKDDGEWSHCFEVKDIKIPSVAYLGFSAETGELSENHDIISVETRNLFNIAQTQNKAQPANTKGKGRNYDTNKKSSEQGGSWGGFFLKIMLFLLVCGGGYVGFTIYRTNSRSSRF